MDFQKCLFWICFIIISKITFIVFDLNLIQYEFARHFGPVICNNIPIEIRSTTHFDTFNTDIRKSKTKNCWWKLCKTYLKDLSFLNITQYNAFLKPRVSGQRNKQYSRELRALIYFETNLALLIMCLYSFILWF